MTTKTETRKVPAAAMRFEAGPCEFGEPADGSKNVPVKITARSGQPIDHWFWGKIVHDLAGMKLHKKSLPIDYVHWADEVLGYLDKFETGSGDLVVSGELVPYGDTDRAAEVAHKAQNGVPYEASIFFSGPLKLEELSEGTEAKVNGYSLQGPALIVRQWNLRGVAICPYGADRNTKTQFAAGDEVSVLVSVQEASAMAEKPNKETTEPDPKQLSGEGQQQTAGETGKQTPPPLPDKQAEGAEPSKKPTEPAGKLAEGADDPRAECKRFIDAFGPESGAKWFAEGKTFAEAQQLHAEAQAKEIEGLKQKLAGVDRGEEEALSGSPDGGGPKATDEQKGNFGGLSALVSHNQECLSRRN